MLRKLVAGVGRPSRYALQMFTKRTMITCKTTTSLNAANITNKVRYGYIIQRSMGGYIEDAQLASLGLEIYQDLHGSDKFPPVTFTIPHNDDEWPSNLWGYELGKGVEEHLARFYPKKVNK